MTHPWRRWKRASSFAALVLVVVAALVVSTVAWSETTAPGVLSAKSTTAAAAPVTGRTSAPTEVVNRSLTIQGLSRTYQIIEPTHPAAARLPVIVVLHGREAPISNEEARDGLVPLVSEGQAVLVYPVGIGASWDAGACCGLAQSSGVDDVAFLTTVIHQIAQLPGVDPHRVYLMGYSNGGKMAYRLVCTEPRLVAAVAVVNAVPVINCPAGPPVPLLQIAGTADPDVVYDTGPPQVVGGFAETSVVAEVAAWRERDNCTGQSVMVTAGILQAQLWSTCADGSSVELASYIGGTHLWPYGGNGTPSGAQTIWKFLTQVGIQGAAVTSQAAHSAST